MNSVTKKIIIASLAEFKTFSTEQQKEALRELKSRKDLAHLHLKSQRQDAYLTACLIFLRIYKNVKL